MQPWCVLKSSFRNITFFKKSLADLKLLNAFTCLLGDEKLSPLRKESRIDAVILFQIPENFII